MLKKYFINTYGCQMNVHESEKLAGILAAKGYEECGAQEDADVVVFNTCCIRDTAERRALGNIGIIKGLKKQKPSLVVAVVGCMPQQDGVCESIREKYPYVDIVLGTRNIAMIADEIDKVLISRENVKKRSDKKYRCFDNTLPSDYLEIDENTPTVRTSFPNAWVNIIYGCNNFCSYCIVPYVRGREISRSIDSVLDEVKRCVDDGYKEITLLGQNVNSYGNDLGGKVNFATLLHEIDKIEGKFRVRFMTSHPKDLTESVMDEMAASSKICSNLHLPMQAGSDRVLRDMNRRYDSAKYLGLIDKLRERMPNIGITTDIMVGFPTETEEDFKDTLDIVEKVRFSNAFTFIYSPRKGTPAAKMAQIPYAVKQERISRLISLQNRITKEISDTYTGGVYEVLCEDTAKSDGAVCGRTDSGRLVTFDGSKDDIGKFFNVKIVESRSASLFGRKEGEIL
ncbi:MAG: tRNA (N6-isopentenyl adenosine(37)-C2)-methylthiotransferase MiaB [Bacteroides sp.]|nr:tRNA (N6-isopentenyl adenosine(37)-C2)-methylthiotransferase MiaB [Bacillota bacterium]MCM1393872.1 tRNA (N6-isopentenyl adenosine(37)-C2)-methylthiotransferase MiaB [[Eubacterium] siraeum]MCM1455831.1 tRNA (N6-isopentenyl adenosine(37)-C2)-methylthiotransferase MiaB [Bacteroides sp.]